MQNSPGSSKSAPMRQPRPILPWRPNVSLGCDGSRKFSGIADDEMVRGLPAEMLPELAAALRIVTAAPGSK